MLGGQPGDPQILQLLRRRLDFSRISKLIRLPADKIPLLQEQSTNNAADIVLAVVYFRTIDRPGRHQANTLAPPLERPYRFDSIGVKLRRDDHLGKETGSACRLAEPAVGTDDIVRQLIFYFPCPLGSTL